MNEATSKIKLGSGWTGTVTTQAGDLVARLGAAAKLPTSDEWEPLLERLIANPAAMPEYELLKYSPRGEIIRGRLEWDGGAADIVCRHLPAPSRWRRLLTREGASKARVNFDAGWGLLRAGISTALPLAILERNGPGGEAWLITEFVPGLVDLDHVALALLPRTDPARARAVKNRIVVRLIELLVGLRERQTGHRDLKASNILLTDWDRADESVRLWVMDLEGVRRATGERRYRQPLVRLAASLLEHPSITRTDYLRVLLGYMGRTEASVEQWKRRYREIGSEARAYVRRARRRKANKLDGFEVKA